MNITMKTRIAIATSGLGLAALVGVQQAQAHGFTQTPKARQAICQAQAGYWWPDDGSGIPNLACRAAFLESGYVPFVQEHEISVNVANYQDMDAVRAGVPDGRLCSAGSAEKQGLDLASPHWQKTTVMPDGNGEILVRFNAQTPHNPSYWQFYLSKPHFNADTDVLKWQDLDLVSEFDDTPFYTAPDGNRYYDFQVKIPADREGQALLYTRWQRYDPAGEGFYNCSDIIIDQDVDTPDTWYALSYYLRQGQQASVGDSVWLRLFDETGAELINETLVVSENNVEQWQANFAQQIINQYPTLVNIGVEDQQGKIAFNGEDLTSNQVWSTNKNYSYQLSITAKPDNRAPVVQPLDDLSLTEGESVNVHAHAYDDDQDPITYNWSTTGAITLTGSGADVSILANQVDQDASAQVTVSVSDGKLSSSTSFSVAVKNETDNPDVPAWQASATYVAGDKVIYNGTVYTAKWWNTNQQPDTGNAWQAESSGDETWLANASYQQGAEVVYNGVRYRARWWTQGDTPGDSEVWEKA